MSQFDPLCSHIILSSKHIMRRLTLALLFRNTFAKVPMAPPDPILGISVAYNSDPDTRKVNLGVGAYRDDSLKPVVFNVVRKVEEQVVAEKLNKEYAPIEGLAGFNTGSQKLVFGENAQVLKEGRVITAQCLSGTGALRIGFELVKQEIAAPVLLPSPTWANHQNIVRKSNLTFTHYPYYDPLTKRLKLPQLIEHFSKAVEGTVVLLHACAHNPTGVDPSPQDWLAIADVMAVKKLVPFFDTAYQGFASGDLAKDIAPVRLFADRGFSMLVAQSFAKNMGLYGERVGALHVVTSDRQTGAKVMSQVKNIIRANYSSPPIHGARIADKILNNEALRAEWALELKSIANRVITMRAALRSRLEQLGTPGSWSHITEQIGMFSYTGLSETQVKVLVEKYHIHMLRNGRIAMVGLNTKNVNYVADAIHEAVTGKEK